MSDLTGKISSYNHKVPALLSYLSSKVPRLLVKIDAEGSKKAIIGQLLSHINPAVILVRNGNNPELKQQILHSLIKDHSCVLLDVHSLTCDESKRDTDLGH